MSRRSLAPPESTRQAILDTAAALFLRIGYGKTTVADIAGSLGMSSANIYRFFASKDAINDAICRRTLAALRAPLVELAHGSGSPAERLATLIVSLHRWHRDQLTGQRQVHEMVDAAMAQNWQAVAEHRDACGAIVAALIREGQRAGLFGPGDPDALGQTVMAACCSLLHPTVLAQQARQQPEPTDEQPARRIAWLVVQALANTAGTALP